MTEEIKLTDEQASQVKEQLLTQLDNFPEDKRNQIKQQINSMSASEVEQFVKQNQLSHMDPNKCIFCSIVGGETPSMKIAESEKEIAVLEINPLTKGHTILIPKKHDSSPTTEFAKIVAENLQQKLKSKDIEIQEAEVMSHKIMNLIPVYEDTDLNKAKRAPAPKEDLEKLQELLTIREQPPEEPPLAIDLIQKANNPTKPEPIPKLPPRIP